MTVISLKRIWLIIEASLLGIHGFYFIRVRAHWYQGQLDSIA